VDGHHRVEQEGQVDPLRLTGELEGVGIAVESPGPFGHGRGDAGRVVVISSHILHEIDVLTSNIIMLSHGRLLAEGDIHEVRQLLRDHPHQIYIECPDPRALSSQLIELESVQNIHFDRERRGLLLETYTPDLLYQELAQIVVEEKVDIEVMTSPDDNVQAVFQYLTGGRTEEEI